MNSLRWALRYLAPYWKRLVLVLVLSLLGTAFSLYLPYLSRGLVDQALLGRDFSVLTRIVLTFGSLTLLSFVMNVISGMRYTRVSAEVLFDMRIDLYRHLQRLSPRFYARTPLGEIVSRLNADIGEIQRVAGEAALSWVGSVLFLVGTVAMLIYLDVRLFFVSLLLLPPALWALVVYRRKLEGAVAVLRQRGADIGSFLIETLQAMRLIVSSNAQTREVQRFSRKNDAFIDSLMKMRMLTYLSGGLPGVLLAVGTAVVFLYGGSRVIGGAITMGTFVAFVAYQMRLLAPVQGLMGLYTSLATARVSLTRVHEIFDAPVEVEELDDATTLESVRGEVVLESVTFSFDRGAVLKDVSLEIGAGEVIAIVGPSGGGKSTIADLLLRHLDPDAGHVLLDGHDLKTLRLSDLRRHVAIVDQTPFIFNASMGENIRYARPEASDEDVERATRAAGLAAFVAQLPEGLQTEVGERGRALSAGERQRVAIARAFLADPAVLVLDEATASLDPASERLVVAGYEAVMRDRTTIIISHRLELAGKANRVVVLDTGRVVEQGSPSELLSRRGAFYAMHPRGSTDMRTSGSSTVS